ncbi:C-glycoside deglycosidase beta subunit domain-containing protein [Microbacterium trichothecenolyticum]|uniref:C-deglycosylation enzyme beta subunit n=1 Tax=Microbacterium trichothecenolyticum TaxID=69370 RepID=A0A0M2HGJ4_MICTR|nr:DUF6379 domain-containing protein [Microbacterium trichothecenolyticum]KJL45797.1 hypothetical protein RS82_00039 [Microbacterium trichothecenolyticum]
MLEREIIQNRGVENVVEDGEVTGFRFLVRMPNYRGAYGRLIDGIDVRVGDHHWERTIPLWTLHGAQYSLDELQASHLDVHWDLDEPAVITVPHPGGLAPGVHDFDIEIAIHAPYIPARFQPSLFHASRKVTVVA